MKARNSAIGLTSLAAHAVEGLQHQRCKVCWNADGFDFKVPNDVWRAVVPPELVNRVVCLACFDRLASEAGVDYTSHLRRLYFAGVTAGFEFVVYRRP